MSDKTIVCSVSILAMSTCLLKRHNTESHATKRKHCVCLGILPMGPTCPHRIVWFLLPKSVCLRYKPRVLLGPSAERSIIVLSNRWLHWGLFVDDVQTCNYTYMCKYEPAHRKNVHTHKDTKSCITHSEQMSGNSLFSHDIRSPAL